MNLKYETELTAINVMILNQNQLLDYTKKTFLIQQIREQYSYHTRNNAQR